MLHCYLFSHPPSYLVISLFSFFYFGFDMFICYDLVIFYYLDVKWMVKGTEGVK